jgi:hypothetical protein
MKLTNIFVDLQILPHELNFCIRIFHQARQSLLDGLHLLTDSTKNAFFQTIELVEASPCSDLAQTNEDTTHSLEIKCLVTTKHEHEPAELNTESFDRLGFTLNMKICQVKWNIIEVTTTHQFQQAQKDFRQADYPKPASMLNKLYPLMGSGQVYLVHQDTPIHTGRTHQLS